MAAHRAVGSDGSNHRVGHAATTIGTTDVRLRNAAEEAALEICRLISRMKDGDDLLLGNERELIDQVGIGRDAVRSALSVLEVQGIVERRRGAGGGVYVAHRDARRMVVGGRLFLLGQQATRHEATEARTSFEPEIIALAAQNADEHDVEQLRVLLEAAAGETDPTSWFRLMRDFHLALVQAAKNPFALQMGAMLYAAAHADWPAAYDLDRARDGIAEHRVILAAVIAGDAPAAFSAAQAHLGLASTSYAVHPETLLLEWH